MDGGHGGFAVLGSRATRGRSMWHARRVLTATLLLTVSFAAAGVAAADEAPRRDSRAPVDESRDSRGAAGNGTADSPAPAEILRPRRGETPGAPAADVGETAPSAEVDEVFGQAEGAVSPDSPDSGLPAATPDPAVTPDPAAAAGAAGDPDTRIEVLSDGTDLPVKWAGSDTFAPTGTCPARPSPPPAPPPSYVRLPGDDCFPDDRIVRTLDVTVFRVHYEINPALDSMGNAIETGAIVLDVDVIGGAVIPAGFLGLACPGGYSKTSPTSFTCGVGTKFTTSTTGAYDVPVVAPMAMGDGKPFHLHALITDSGGLPSGSDDSEEITTSARPRFDLVKRAVAVATTPNPPAAPAGDGQRQEWAIGIRGGTMGYTDIRGLSALSGTISLDDLATAPAGVAEWFVSCSTGTAPGWPQQTGTVLTNPLNQLTAPTALSCTPSANGTPALSIGVNLGVDWNRAVIVESPPGTFTAAPAPVFEAFVSTPLAAGLEGLVAYFRVFTWSSNADLDAATPPPGDGSGTATVCNTVETSAPGQPGVGGTGFRRPWDPAGAVSTWAPVDVDGKPNLGGTLSPVANNGECIVKEAIPRPPDVVDAYYVKQGITPQTNGQGVPQGGTTRSLVRFVNTGNVPYPAGAVICDKWDDSHFDLTSLNATASSSAVTFTIEYATGDWGDSPSSTPSQGDKWFRQATSDCSDTNARFSIDAATGLPTMPWALGGNAPPAHANMVRVTIGTMPAGTLVDLQPQWTMKPGFPAGEEFRNYSAAFFPHRPAATAWERSTCAPLQNQSCPPGVLTLGQSAGNNSHWWTNVVRTVEVNKDRVGPRNVEAGSMVSWRIRARALPGPGDTQAVTLTDQLPPGFSYVGPTVSAAGFQDPGQPTSCTPALGTIVNYPNVQTCEWAPLTMPFLGGPDNVDFTFAVSIDPFTPPGVRVNVARATTPDDPRPPEDPSVDLRADTDDVLVLGATRAHIDKSVAPSIAGPGDTVTYTLRYGNPASTPVNAMDGTDLLPFPGDPRGSSFSPLSFTLTGINPSTTGGEEMWVSGESPASLDLLDGIADGYIDPNSAGVLTAPRWCRLADVGTSACPQIPSVTSVTATRLVGRPSPGGAPFLPPGTPFHVVTITYLVGDCALGDTLSNSWMARFDGLFFPVRFPARAAGVSGCVPGLMVVKEVQDSDGEWAESAEWPAGSDVTWRITVTNTGGTSLTGLAFSDPSFTGCEAAGAAAAPATLVSGGSFTFTCTDRGVARGYVNIVTVSGLDPDGRPVVDDDDASVRVRDPSATPPPPGKAAPPRPGGRLALTGFLLRAQVTVAALSIGLGTIGLRATRRRQRWVARVERREQ